MLDNGDGENPMKAHDYKPENDDDLVKRGIWARYRNLLGSILAMITEGEAKGIIRGLNEKGEELDGFKVMALFKERYDHIKEGNSILRLLGDILHPPEIKKCGRGLQQDQPLGNEGQHFFAPSRGNVVTEDQSSRLD